LNLITLSHLSDTGQADRTVLLDRQTELFYWTGRQNCSVIYHTMRFV